MDAIAFVSKKILSACLYPVGFSLGLLFIGIAVWLIKRSCRAAMIFVSTGTVLLLVMSFPITSILLLSDIEKRAGSYADPDLLRAIRIRYIVVLGGAGKTERLTPADRIGPSIFRVIEGVRLWKEVPGTKLVLSGMGFGPEANNPALMGQLAIDLGVPERSLIVKAQAWDTRHEATLIFNMIGREPFALVTSAYHMPRALQLFRRLGLNPIPSPCEFKAVIWPPWYRWFVPDADALQNTTFVIHEYIGMLWAKIRLFPRIGSFGHSVTGAQTPPMVGHISVDVRSPYAFVD